ncbi:MAG: hypothetical protein JWP37_2694 [Mucilaginibacter sp.]|nr:hypothetical protein [Mucilaginibacter sp.]
MMLFWMHSEDGVMKLELFTSKIIGAPKHYFTQITVVLSAT